MSSPTIASNPDELSNIEDASMSVSALIWHLRRLYACDLRLDDGELVVKAPRGAIDQVWTRDGRSQLRLLIQRRCSEIIEYLQSEQQGHAEINEDEKPTFSLPIHLEMSCEIDTRSLNKLEECA